MALIVVLSAAVLHATWNVVLASRPRGPDTTAVALALGLLAWTPLALARWRVDGGVWPYIGLSAALELAYLAALNLAYARLPARATYPIARGLAPMLLLPAVGLAGGRVPTWAGLAVAAISTGVLLTAGRTGLKAMAYSAPVAVCIAGYTFVDSRGLRHADPATYLWLTMLPVVTALLIVRVGTRQGRARLRAEVRPGALPIGLAIGLGVFGAYGLTLAALAMVPAAQVPAVAALRETSILFVVGLSWWSGRRSEHPPGLTTALGAVLVFGGVAVLAIA